MKSEAYNVQAFTQTDGAHARESKKTKYLKNRVESESEIWIEHRQMKSISSGGQGATRLQKEYQKQTRSEYR